MEDMAPGLLERIQEEYRRRVQKSKTLAGYTQALEAGTADYAEAAEAALELGKILAAVYQEQISSDVLPDGRMYYNIALRVLDPTLKENYENVADYAEAVQKLLNQKAGLGLKAVRSEVNQDAIDGIVNRVSSEDNFDDVKWILDAPVKTFAQKIVDESVRANAEFHHKAGLKPKIIRKSSGHCCAWCSRMAGTYSYPNVPKDVYRRHDNCNCTVEYDPGGAKRQDVWSKQWKYEQNPVKIEQRKQLSDQTVRRKAEYLVRDYAKGQNNTRERLLVNRSVGMVPVKVQQAMKDTVVEVGKPGASQYDYNHDILYVAKGANQDAVIHEIGHLVENKLLDNEKVEIMKTEFLKDVPPGCIETEIYYDASGNEREVYLIKSEKMVSEYQGRLYVSDWSEIYDENWNINSELVQEFMSEPFREYIQNPDRLRERFPEFYELIREAVE